MRQRVRWNPSRFLHSLALLLSLCVFLALSGCGGGGGGGGGNPNPNPGGTTATVTGNEVDSATGNPVPNAIIRITGTQLFTTTGADGKFSRANVPLTATGFTVSSPDATRWLNIIFYPDRTNTIRTYAVDPQTSRQCSLPLPALQATTIPLPADIQLMNANAAPPPPPGGCPQ
jgi:hypothetical protein